MLSDSESDSNDLQLTINEHYAKAYVAKKEREELSKLKETYGSDPEEDDLEEDSSDEESEDEDGEELTPAVDAAILRTLAKIKRKDPDIYNKNKSIFNEEHNRTGGKTLISKTRSKDKAKPLTMKQHALSSMLRPISRTPSPEPKLPTHEQEQSQLARDVVSAFHDAIKDDDAGDDLLVLREKTKDEIEREEEEYQEFLEREVGEDIRTLVTVEDSTNMIKIEEEEEKVETSAKGRKKRKPSKTAKEVKSQTDQEFLMSYILNRGWVDRSAKRVPTYNEITHRRSLDGPSREDGPSVAKSEASLEDEDNFDDFVDRFEGSYNFRFEEPGAAEIPRHPRNITSTVRRQDTTRKEARERRKQRKEEELIRKKEEVRRMKALKMKELRQKLDKIGREGGIEIDPEAFADFDLDGDWDAQKHDKQMAGLYEQDESGDIEKPQWEDDINIDDILPQVAVDGPVAKSKKKKKKDRGAEDVADGIDVHLMDADNPQVLDDEEWDGTEEMRKRKIQEYMDEVYKMEFNDMVGDTATRFHYIPVAARSYSLTPQEMLLATDTDLNEYMGIKKFAPYRKDGRWEIKRADRLRELKAKLKVRSWGPGHISADGAKQPRKRKGKKERQRAKAVTGIEGIGKNETKTVVPLSPPLINERRKG